MRPVHVSCAGQRRHLGRGRIRAPGAQDRRRRAWDAHFGGGRPRSGSKRDTGARFRSGTPRPSPVRAAGVIWVHESGMPTRLHPGGGRKDVHQGHAPRPTRPREGGLSRGRPHAPPQAAAGRRCLIEVTTVTRPARRGRGKGASREGGRTPRPGAPGYPPGRDTADSTGGRRAGLVLTIPAAGERPAPHAGLSPPPCEPR